MTEMTRAGVNPQPPPNRLNWIDVAKGAGIALVVLGHTLIGLMNAGLLAPVGVGATVNRWVYAFHMPLFFVLAGLFFARTAQRPFGSFVADRMVRLGYPYVVWVVLQTIVQVALSRFANHHVRLDSLTRAAYLPPMQFWFIYVLLLQSLFAGALLKAGFGSMGLLAVSLAGFIAGRWVPFGTWGPLIQMRDYLPYLAVGVVLGDRGLLERIRTLPAAVAGVLGAVGFGVVTVFLHFNLLENREAGLVAALAGTAATLALASLADRFRGAPFLASWGRQSLAIYCAHTLFSAGARIVLQKIAHVENVGIHLAAGIGAGLYGPLALVWASERLRFPYLFELPRSKRREPAAAAGDAVGE